MSVSATCPLTAEALESEKCAACGIVNWATTPDVQPQQSRVFLPAAAAWTAFPAHSFQTPGCVERLSADGREYGLLRYSNGLAFGHEVLHQYPRQLKDQRSTWCGWWKSAIGQCPHVRS
jgi:hypothetical protein